MKTKEFSSEDFTLALRELEPVLSLRELVRKEETLVARLNTYRFSEHSSYKYAVTILKTHIRFLEDSNENLDVREESARIQKMVANILDGRISLGAAVLGVLEDRKKHHPAWIFPGRFSRYEPGTYGGPLLDDDEY